LFFGGKWIGASKDKWSDKYKKQIVVLPNLLNNKKEKYEKAACGATPSEHSLRKGRVCLERVFRRL